MSPIDNHLRDSLTQHAAEVSDDVDRFAAIERRARDMHRRRVAWVSGATAVVLAGGVVGGLALTGGDHDTLQVPVTDGSGTPTPGPSGGGSTASPVPKASLDTYRFLGWPTRHGPGTSAADFADDVLWGGELPDGTFVVVRQATVKHEARAVALITPPTGDEYTLIGAQLAENTREVSFVLPGNAYPWVLVIGVPGTAQIEYETDPGEFSPVETVDGWALFKRTGSGPRSSEPDRIRLLDGDGDVDHPLYYGPIDTGPSEPDV
jgi:hypothetical protein